MKIDEYFDNLNKYNNNYSNKKYETNKFINFSRVQLLELKGIPGDIIKKIEAIDKDKLDSSDSNKMNNNSHSSHSSNEFKTKHRNELDVNVNESGRVYIFPSVPNL